MLKGVEERYPVYELDERESSPEYSYSFIHHSNERGSSPEVGIENSDNELYQSHERECIHGDLENNQIGETKDKELPEQEIDEEKLPICIEKWKVPGVIGHRMRCKVCARFMNIVLKHTKGHYPNITTVGVQYRKLTLTSHLKTIYHKECVIAETRVPLSEPVEETKRNTLENMILCSQAKTANMIGKRAISVFADAKCLSNSARSWASRQAAERFGDIFNFVDDQYEQNIPKISLNYSNPNFHAELIDCIVTADRDLIANKINECVALSLRVDGSVDRTSIDKIYVLAKTVNKSGHLESIFIGVGVQTERKASGLFEAVKNTINQNGENLFEVCVRKMTSFVTDGASINTGERTGLWQIIDDQAKRIGITQNIVKIWCAAHRSDLVLKDLKKKVLCVNSMIDTLKSISSHFHVSAMRTNALKNIAATEGTGLLNLPRFYEVRWAEFTSNLLRAVLVSWNTLVIYFSKQTDAADKGFRDYLTNYDNLKLIALMADVMYLFTIFQKRAQANDLNIVSLVRHLNWLQSKIDFMETSDVSEGWSQKLSSSIILKTINGDEENKVRTLKGIELTDNDSRIIRNKRIDFTIIRKRITKSIAKCLHDRFVIDMNLVEKLGPFCKLDSSANVKIVTELIAPDMNDCDLYMQYEDACSVQEFKNLSFIELLPQLARDHESFGKVFEVFARIAAATPHSADVERSISANNRLKTNGRSNFDISSENKWLFIHFNMPTLESWNPRKCVLEWINRKQRRHHDLTVHASNEGARKTTAQPYYYGIFEAANSKRTFSQYADDNSDEESEAHVQEAKRPRAVRQCF